MIELPSNPSGKPNHDPLTGLGDRQVLVEFLTQAIAMSQRKHKRVAVISLSVGGIGSVRERHGTQVADQVLVSTARRVHTVIREADLASRVGEDDFVVVAQEIDGRSGAEIMARRILQATCEPVQVEESNVTVGVSIGVAIYPLHGSFAEELIQIAEKAMFQAQKRSESDFTILD